jgi:hypothetical protein
MAQRHVGAFFPGVCDIGKALPTGIHSFAAIHLQAEKTGLKTLFVWSV